MAERPSSAPTAVRRVLIPALLLAILPAAPALATPATQAAPTQQGAPAQPQGAQAAQPQAPAPQSPQDIALQAKAQDLQRRLDQQYAAIERLSQQLEKADEVERHLRQEQTNLQLRRAAAALELASSQQRLHQLRGRPQQQAQLEATSESVQHVRRRTFDLDRVRGRLTAHLVRQQRRDNGMAAQRRQLDLLNKRLAATLKGLNGRLKGALQAQQDQIELQRRSAYNIWAAQVGGLSQATWMQAARAAQLAVAYAMRQLGRPYQWGAEGPWSFDCSGLTSAAYRSGGVGIPRVAADQFYAGVHIAVADLIPGDLLFYADNPANPATIHHVGMYIGKGLMVHAPHTGDVVRIASIWRGGFAGATRVIPGVLRPGAAPPSTLRAPVPNPPMSTLPPPASAPPTTRRPPTSTTKPSKTTSPPTTKPPTSTSGRTTTSSSSTTSTGTTTSTTTTTAPPTTAAPTTSPPTTAASSTTQQSTATSEATTTTTTASSTTASAGP